MTREEAIAIIRKEYLCVDRDCDIEKSCGRCDLMMPSKEPILQAYKMAIQALEQEPMRDATSEERESVDAYIKSISKPTGVDFDSLSDSQTIHHLTDKAYSELCLLAAKGREALQPSGDAVSRQAVEDKLLKLCNEIEVIFANIRMQNVDESVCGLCEYDCPAPFECKGYYTDECFKLADEIRHKWQSTNDLPSVKPLEKTGHWIFHEIEDTLRWYECDQCGAEAVKEYDYCHGCGARMVKPQAESDHKCHNCKHYTSGERDGSCGSYICKHYSNWESEDKK